MEVLLKAYKRKSCVAVRTDCEEIVIRRCVVACREKKADNGVGLRVMCFTCVSS
jgi:hypothetical protein